MPTRIENEDEVSESELEEEEEEEEEEEDDEEEIQEEEDTSSQIYSTAETTKAYDEMIQYPFSHQCMQYTDVPLKKRYFSFLQSNNPLLLQYSEITQTYTMDGLDKTSPTPEDMFSYENTLYLIRCIPENPVLHILYDHRSKTIPIRNYHGIGHDYDYICNERYIGILEDDDHSFTRICIDPLLEEAHSEFYHNIFSRSVYNDYDFKLISLIHIDEKVVDLVTLVYARNRFWLKKFDFRFQSEHLHLKTTTGITALSLDEGEDHTKCKYFSNTLPNLYTMFLIVFSPTKAVLIVFDIFQDNFVETTIALGEEEDMNFHQIKNIYIIGDFLLLVRDSDPVVAIVYHYIVKENDLTLERKDDFAFPVFDPKETNIPSIAFAGLPMHTQYQSMLCLVWETEAGTIHKRSLRFLPSINNSGVLVGNSANVTKFLTMDFDSNHRYEVRLYITELFVPVLLVMAKYSDEDEANATDIIAIFIGDQELTPEFYHEIALLPRFDSIRYHVSPQREDLIKMRNAINKCDPNIKIPVTMTVGSTCHSVHMHIQFSVKAPHLPKSLFYRERIHYYMDSPVILLEQLKRPVLELPSSKTPEQCENLLEWDYFVPGHVWKVVHGSKSVYMLMKESEALSGSGGGGGGGVLVTSSVSSVSTLTTSAAVPVSTLTTSAAASVSTRATSAAASVSTLATSASAPVSTLTTSASASVSTLTTSASAPVSTLTTSATASVSTLATSASASASTLATSASAPVSTLTTSASAPVSTLTTSASAPVSTLTTSASAPVSNLTTSASASASVTASTLKRKSPSSDDSIQIIEEPICTKNSRLRLHPTKESSISLQLNPTKESSISLQLNPTKESSISLQLNPTKQPVSLFQDEDIPTVDTLSVSVYGAKPRLTKARIKNSAPIAPALLVPKLETFSRFAKQWDLGHGDDMKNIYSSWFLDHIEQQPPRPHSIFFELPFPIPRADYRMNDLIITGDSTIMVLDLNELGKMQRFSLYESTKIHLLEFEDRLSNGTFSFATNNNQIALLQSCNGRHDVFYTTFVEGREVWKKLHHLESHKQFFVEMILVGFYQGHIVMVEVSLAKTENKLAFNVIFGDPRVEPMEWKLRTIFKSESPEPSGFKKLLPGQCKYFAQVQDNELLLFTAPKDDSFVTLHPIQTVIVDLDEVIQSGPREKIFFIVSTSFPEALPPFVPSFIHAMNDFVLLGDPKNHRVHVAQFNRQNLFFLPEKGFGPIQLPKDKSPLFMENYMLIPHGPSDKYMYEIFCPWFSKYEVNTLVLSQDVMTKDLKNALTELYGEDNEFYIVVYTCPFQKTVLTVTVNHTTVLVLSSPREYPFLIFQVKDPSFTVDIEDLDLENLQCFWNCRVKLGKIALDFKLHYVWIAMFDPFSAKTDFTPDSLEMVEQCFENYLDKKKITISPDYPVKASSSSAAAAAAAGGKTRATTGKGRGKPTPAPAAGRGKQPSAAGRGKPAGNPKGGGVAGARRALGAVSAAEVEGKPKKPRGRGGTVTIPISQSSARVLEASALAREALKKRGAARAKAQAKKVIDEDEDDDEDEDEDEDDDEDDDDVSDGDSEDEEVSD